VTIGIYSITHRESGKRYVGKSINVEARLWQHKNLLTKPVRSKDCNRHLYNAVRKYGWSAFDTEVLEDFDWVDEDYIAARELHWMDHYRTCERAFGYNLRRDSSTKMEVHVETREIQSAAMTGFGNPNFSNFWTDEQKQRMSEISKARHASGEFYGEEWRAKQSASSIETWKDLEKRVAMGKKVSEAKQKFDFIQSTRDGEFVRRWTSIKEIVEANPTWKWQNIYSASNGHKPTYHGFTWRKEIKVGTE